MTEVNKAKGVRHQRPTPFHALAKLAERKSDSLRTFGGYTASAAAVLIANGALHYTDFWHDVIFRADAAKITSLVIAMGCVGIGSLAVRHRSSTLALEASLGEIAQAIESERVTIAQLRDQQGVAKATQRSQRSLMEALTRRAEVLEREKENLNRRVQVLTDKLCSGGHQEDDNMALWQMAPGSHAISCNCRWNKEVMEVVTPDGMRFELTEWAVRNVLPRLVEPGALGDWRIVIYVPKVDTPFDTLAMLSVQKFVFLIDSLCRIAAAQNKRVYLDRIRISIVRKMNPEHQHRSISVFKQQSAHDEQVVAVTYHRSPSGRDVDLSDGKILVHRGRDDRDSQLRVADGYYFAGTHLSYEQLRDMVKAAKFPDFAADVGVISSDHLRIA